MMSEAAITVVHREGRHAFELPTPTGAEAMPEPVAHSTCGSISIGFSGRDLAETFDAIKAMAA